MNILHTLVTSQTSRLESRSFPRERRDRPECLLRCQLSSPGAERSFQNEYLLILMKHMGGSHLCATNCWTIDTQNKDKVNQFILKIHLLI